MSYLDINSDLKYFYMNKTQLVDGIAEKTGLSKVDAKKALEAFIETVSDALKHEERVT